MFSVGLDSKTFSPKTLADHRRGEQGRIRRGAPARSSSSRSSNARPAALPRVHAQVHVAANPHTQVAVAVQVKGRSGRRAGRLHVPAVEPPGRSAVQAFDDGRVIQSRYLLFGVAIAPRGHARRRGRDRGIVLARTAARRSCRWLRLGAARRPRRSARRGRATVPPAEPAQPRRRRTSQVALVGAAGRDARAGRHRRRPAPRSCSSRRS